MLAAIASSSVFLMCGWGHLSLAKSVARLCAAADLTTFAPGPKVASSDHRVAFRRLSESMPTVSPL